LFEGYRRKQRIVAARQAGAGLYTNEWELAGDPQTLVDSILTWCRDTMATSRRPYGICHFDIALTCRRAGQLPRRLHLRRGEPLHLYAETSELVAQLRDFIARESANTAAAPGKLVVALSSWGDITHAALMRS